MRNHSPTAKAGMQQWIAYAARVVVVLLVTLMSVTACGGRSTPARPTSTLVPVITTTPVSATPTPSALCTFSSGKQVPCAKITVVAPTRPSAPQMTVTGKVTQVEPRSGTDRLRLTLVPESDPRTPLIFEIKYWNTVSVAFFWEGLETPTSIWKDAGYSTVLKYAINHIVTIGYYATHPPTVDLVSIHKLKGDQQK